MKSDLSSVRYSTLVHWKNHFLQGHTRSCITGHPVHLSGLRGELQGAGQAEHRQRQDL